MKIKGTFDVEDLTFDQLALIKYAVGRLSKHTVEEAGYDAEALMPLYSALEQAIPGRKFGS
jgi:argininosuccinate lyase